MSRHAGLATAAALILAVSVKAAAGEEGFRARCESAGAEEAQAYCSGFIEAVVNAGHAERRYLRSGCSTSKCHADASDEGRGFLAGRDWCLPKDLAAAERRKTVAAWLRDNAKLPFVSDAELVAEALAETWPCED